MALPTSACDALCSCISFILVVDLFLVNIIVNIAILIIISTIIRIGTICILHHLHCIS